MSELIAVVRDNVPILEVLLTVCALFGALAVFAYPDPQRAARRRARRTRV